MPSTVIKTNVPKHIAIIMDGNGRWAKQRGKFRIFGHKNAIKAVRETVESAAELGVEYLTLYAFSTENWNRPKIEVQALMEILVDSLSKELDTLNKNNIRLLTIGNEEMLPSNCLKKLKHCIKETENNDHMSLILALSYSSQWEILEAVKSISEDVKSGLISSNDIDQTLFSSYLSTKGIPDPELMIRTSGEYRISNFLLWQLAYSELYFLDKYWPDFRKEDLIAAISDYNSRERRFGKTGEQIEKK